MAKTPEAELPVTAAQAAAFRLARQHLAPAPRTSLVGIVRDTAGIQAQLMSAAELALWTRRRETTRVEIQAALFERRELVKTSAMRMTLHLVPAADLPMIVAACRASTTFARIERWHRLLGAKPDQIRAMIDVAMDALRDGPRTQQELNAIARRKAGKGVRAWIDHAWNALRPAVIDGLIVYGPMRGSEVTFVRVDQWLGQQKPMAVDEARAALLRRFLSAFGPATAADFAKWTGLKVTEARPVLDAIAGELLPVSVDGAAGWIRRVDAQALRGSTLDPDAVRLLGAFDPLLLAHASKAHLVGAAHFPRVYRPQGWISPVVLRGGTIAGVWFPKTIGARTTLDVQLFGRATPALREGIAREAEAIGRFLGVRCDTRLTRDTI